ncbi:metal transporter [Desulfosarcina ovata]|uniref:Metal transporter n=1 Tax=Desulfosarcina ovata subsp. ovata TaxID=2752305 RepID=A0A5K8AHP6_9BACT|nr:metal transporter [Desulfosarcina ovata]BBO92009.1 hypothetical protein DSCOOX_51890 [Desulfosarcina ovata subsp. ovata]
MVEKKTEPVQSSLFRDMLAIWGNPISAFQTGFAGLSRYTADFFISYLVSSQYFQRVERDRLLREDPLDSLDAYLGLLEDNIELITRSLNGSARAMETYLRNETGGYQDALQQALCNHDLSGMAEFGARQSRLMEQVAHGYPEAIAAIEPEYGFHFERGEHPLIDTTGRFELYRVIPSQPAVQTRMDAKPVLIIPPYVLGANILGFLPAEQRSYAHAFANQGVPTYIRVLKDIATTPDLQTMTAEDDARDTQRFCKAIQRAHGKPVTLNGYCQGGFNSLCNLLSGILDNLVDAFITCVSPMDGTRSQGLARFLARLPERFNDLAYGTKILPNGNRVADGRLMGWVYKLKSIEHEIPAAAFFNDLMMFARQTTNGPVPINKTAAALNYWLQNERNDLPLEITRVSFASYNISITADGTLPVRLFGEKLNLKRLQEKKLPWLICYGTNDDLVEKETALAPLDYIDAEVSPFPKGHVAIATSWSFPDSACALHTRFGDGNWRGPVRFHLDLDAQLEQPRRRTSKPQPATVAADADGSIDGQRRQKPVKKSAPKAVGNNPPAANPGIQQVRKKTVSKKATAAKGKAKPGASHARPAGRGKGKLS